MVLSAELIERLYRKAGAERWGVAIESFARALENSAQRAPAESAVERYLTSLHLSDLALACACAAGHEQAWEHFVREHRPLLYRAADALAPGGAAREIADSLYADLYGLQEHDGERRSLFRYFHGRSSLATWLRAVLAQRFVDRVRSDRRLDQLPEDEATLPAVAVTPPDPDRARYSSLIERALVEAVNRLDARDRLRLGCYYTQGLTLAQTGRLLGEHEATVSRRLARTRRKIRADVERQLHEAGLTDAAVVRCFECAVEDCGAIDLSQILQGSALSQVSGVTRQATVSDERGRKESTVDRSS